LRISPRIFEKILNDPSVMLRGMVKMIHEKVIQYLIKKAKDEKSLNTPC